MIRNFFLVLLAVLGGLLPLRAQPAGLEVITSGERKWELLLQDIAGARQTIDLDTTCWRTMPRAG